MHKEVFPAIEAKEIEGYRCVELLRHELKDEVEFITIMTFDSLENIIGLQGKDYEKSYVPDSARKLLKRWDKVAVHFTAVEKRTYR